MTEKQLQIMGIVALVLVIVTVFLYSGINFTFGGFIAGTPLIQGFDPGNIGSIVIRSGEDIVTIESVGDEFTIKEKNNYPASMQKINELVIKSLEIRLAEIVSENKDFHGDLGVAEDSDDSVTVSFRDEEGKTLVSFIKGNADSRSSGVYVRLAEENTVYSTVNYLQIGKTPKDYIDTKLFEIKAKEIRQVKVNTPEGNYTLLRRDIESEDDSEDEDEYEVVLQNAPSGKTTDESELEDVFEAITDLAFDDVVVDENIRPEFNSLFECFLESGLVYRVQLATLDDKNYIRLSAQGPDVEGVEISRDEPDEELKKKEAVLLAVDKAEEFNNLHLNRIYEISSWKADKMKTPFDDLFEEEEEDNEVEDADSDQ